VYVPTEKKFEVTSREDVGDDCVRLSGLPVGNHVLSVRADPAHPTHAAAVSHLIIF
jgi:hypothetical protein